MASARARMSPQRRSPGRPAGGSDRVVRAVLAAAVRQLGERGYAGLSIDDVARAAGVNKTTVYRRWPTKADLVLAALAARNDREPPFAASGDLRGDLIALLARKVRQLASSRGRAIGLALLNLDGDSAMVKAVRARRFGLSSKVLQRAIDRGELPPATDPAVLSEMLLAPIILRVLIDRQPAPADYLAGLVDRVLAGAIGAGRLKMQR